MIDNIKTEIKLFEAFAGIGSQYQALKNIAKKYNFKITSLGIIEWYINAIVAYQVIHHKKISQENKLSQQEMCDFLKNASLSADSKKIVNDKYFLKMNLKKLKKIFPYLKNFIENNLIERERERIFVI
ncbi:DNA (cytosine-5-)-methyltransferase N-terminal subunit [Mycoplasmopsis cricetuli]|uniref:DNA (cytosine-5-)-methyltransferase N-terminal subunit n=1 Tax=Mycoplasmopsis cricetuli TaxID=171283 RepID=UPI0006886440|nr:hypothetical protein [Mycoplasmopsis cricetuli]